MAVSTARDHRTAQTNAPQEVLYVCNWLQVLRIHAASVSTQVVDGETVRDGPDEYLIRHPMRVVVGSKASVTFRRDVPLPFPTTRRDHFMAVDQLAP